MQRLDKHEVKMKKLCLDLTGNELKFPVSIFFVIPQRSFKNFDTLFCITRSMPNASISNSNFKLDLDDCSQPMNTMSSADHETISNELETDENNNESNASKKKKSNKKVSDIKFPARLPTLSRAVEEQLVKGKFLFVSCRFSSVSLFLKGRFFSNGGLRCTHFFKSSKESNSMKE